MLADFEKSQNGLGARKSKAGSSSTTTAESPAERKESEEARGASICPRMLRWLYLLTASPIRNQSAARSASLSST